MLLSLDWKSIDYRRIGISDRHTTAAANSGNTSRQFKCAPRALTRWFQVAAGSLDFQTSRFVRGIALEEVLEVRCMRRAVT